MSTYFVAFGQNDFAQCGSAVTGVPNPLENVTNIYAAFQFAIFFRNDGSIYGIGKDPAALGIYEDGITAITTPKKLPDLEKLKAVQAGMFTYYTIILTENGDAYTLNHKNEKVMKKIPVNSLLDAKESIVEVKAGEGFYLLRSNLDNVFFSGDSVANIASTECTKLNITDVATCAGGNACFLIAMRNGGLYGIGKDGISLGIDNSTGFDDLQPIPFFTNKVVVSVGCGFNHGTALTNNNELYSWGRNSDYQCGHPDSVDVKTPHLIVMPFKHSIKNVAYGRYHTLVTNTQGEVYSWGYNSDNQLGHSDKDNMHVPKQIMLVSDTFVEKVAAGCYQSYVIVRRYKGWPFALDSIGLYKDIEIRFS